MELRQKKKRNEGLGFKGGDAVELDRYIARAESAAAQAVESAAAAAAQLGQVGMNADAIAALRRDVDSIGEELPGKYTIPVEGIPETDLSADVRASLGRADTALQPDALSAYRTAAAQDEIDGGKQAKLVSGENIKTVNGQTILGAGDLVIQYSRPNLLDNWYFVGGGSQLGDGVFPINQRGQAAYSGAGYSIDRWELGAGSGITIYSNYVELKSIASPSRRFRQTLTLPAGKYTFSCLLASGSNNNGSADVNGASITLKEGTLTSYTVTHAGGSFSVSLSSGAEGKKINIIACKLELGSYQTLAHNEGTDAIPIWVLNEIPAYSEEFKKCLMYFERVKGQYVGFATGYSTNGTNAYVCGKVNPKVKAPSITLSGTIYLQSANHAGSDSSVSTSLASVFALPSGNFSFICQSSNMVQGEFNQAQFRDTTSYLDFSAE